VSLFAANARGNTEMYGAAANPAATAEVRFKKFRRVPSEEVSAGVVMPKTVSP